MNCIELPPIEYVRPTFRLDARGLQVEEATLEEWDLAKKEFENSRTLVSV